MGGAVWIIVSSFLYLTEKDNEDMVHGYSFSVMLALTLANDYDFFLFVFSDAFVSNIMCPGALALLICLTFDYQYTRVEVRAMLLRFSEAVLMYLVALRLSITLAFSFFF